HVSNQGIVTGANILDVTTDDPDDPAALDPTDTPLQIGSNPKPVTLVSFVVRWEGDVVVVEWETSLELNTFGFQLYRSTSNDQSEAILLTAQPIPSQGLNGGRYHFTDREVTPGTP